MKERLRWFGAGVLFCAIVISLTMVHAQTRTITITQDISIMLDGAPLEFEEDMRPFTMDGRTFLSVRAMADLFGFYVGYDADTHTVLLSSPMQNWDVFEFQSDCFNDELDLTLRYAPHLHSTHGIAATITSNSADESWLRVEDSFTLVKLINGQWRVVPGEFPLRNGGFTMVSDWSEDIHITGLERLPNGHIVAGETYRLVTDVAIWRTNGYEYHTIWTELVFTDDINEAAQNWQIFEFETDYFYNYITFTATNEIFPLGAHRIDVALTNVTSYSIQYGYTPDFFIVKQVGDEWRVVPMCRLFHDIHFFGTLPAGETSMFRFTLNERLYMGWLVKGTYRIVRNMGIASVYSVEEYAVWAEFVIADK